MLIKRLSLIGFILLMFIAAPVTISARSAEVDEIASQLICQCGCYAVLNNCTHGECMVRDGMTQSIQDQLTSGKNKAQIIQTFVSQYGEAVLSTPPKQGFNLTAWIAPFAAIIVGGVVVWIAIKKWVRRGKETAPEPVAITAPQNDDEDAKYRAQLEQDLKDFEERGFR